ncbi:hypothetical protein Mal48_39330 [Thalassoglobus polymorphus]|uniref:Uncharacterized protein n=1 Tax=Thalassoglobus polymorphus TaxID=2527994 RepID=A0A517QSR2_9PLAN|nr:hypothetical protein Mal48_39330 [Thalassoglobus polymorphus]
MSVNARRSIFVTLVVVLLFQGILIKDQGEPYPAIWAPGFHGRGVNTTYTKPSIVFRFSDGSSKTIQQTDLLKQFPDSHHGALMQFFLPISEDSRPPRKLHTLLPGYHLGRFERKNRAGEVGEWFRLQSTRIFAREDLDSVEVDWLTYNWNEFQPIGSKGKYEIDYSRSR